jgi:ABC-type sugar transport system ATPase subunit
MRIEIGGLQRRLNTTTIYVTHDQVEAMTLGDRIVVLADGRIQQVGKPIELYRSPVSRFVAGFIGTPPMNFVEGSLSEADGHVVFTAQGVSIRISREKTQQAKAAQALTLGIRPEDLHLIPSTSASVEGGVSGEVIQGRVLLVERLGGTSHVHFDVEGSGNRMLASVSNDRLPEVGETITVRVPPERVHLFSADGRAFQ